MTPEKEIAQLKEYVQDLESIINRVIDILVGSLKDIEEESTEDKSTLWNLSN